MNIRKYFFNLIDKTKTYKIGNIIKEIEIDLNDENKEKINNKLKQIIINAKVHTKFYENYDLILEKNPVINKETLKKNYTDFLSKNNLENKLCKVTTSGSYGTPTTFFLTKEKKVRQTAEALYFNSLAGYDIGVKNILTRTGFNHKSKVKAFFQNQYLINPLIMNEEWLEETRKILKKMEYMVIFPSVLRILMNYCKKKGDSAKSFKFKGISTGAETLDLNLKKESEDFFGCSVLSRYGATELGVIAQQCPKCGEFHINISSYFVELLKLDSNEKASKGEKARVVITDFYSNAMPLIRYDTGDIAIVSLEEKKCSNNFPRIAYIDGRIAEQLYSTKNENISSIQIIDLLKNESEIFQYQFIQKNEKNYELKIVSLKTIKNHDEIEKTLKKLLGTDAVIEINYTNEIPVLKSGKRPTIINLIGRTDEDINN